MVMGRKKDVTSPGLDGSCGNGGYQVTMTNSGFGKSDDNSSQGLGKNVARVFTRLFVTKV